jgi:4-amino-4-deoxy-L-arabinose transferase-like glycosyltransferase
MATSPAPDPAPPPPRGPFASAERWLAAHRTAVLVLLLAASAVPRIVYFRELDGGPLIRQHLWDQSDMSYYDAWARDIAAGDWLSRNVRPPIHYWHQKVAVDYFRQNPSDPLAPAAGAPVEISRIHALWDRWCGGGRFYQDPLYAYLVALTYRLSGFDVRHVFVWQLALGVLTNVLLWLLARHCFGDRVAAVAALMAVLYAPLLFYEMILLRDSLVVCAGLALAWLGGRQLAAGTPRGWLGVGLLAAVAILLKGHYALLLAGLAAVLCARSLRHPRGWSRAVAPLLLGAAVGLLPLVARNLAVGVPPLGLATNGTVTFVLANARDADVSASDIAHAPAILGSSQNRLLPAVAATLRTQPGVAAYLGLLARRFGGAWHWWERPNNENFYYYGVHARVLRVLPLTFTVVAPLAAAGLVLALPAWRRCLALYLLVAASLTVLVLALVLSRYRVAFAAALIPFAALTLVRVAEWVALRRFARAAAAAAAIAALSLWTARPRPAGTTRVRVADVFAAYNVYYMPLIRKADEAGDWAGAAAIFRESLAYEPPEVRRLGASRPARGAGEIALCQLFSRLHSGYARRLRAAGDAEGVAREERRSNELYEAMGSAAQRGPVP